MYQTSDLPLAAYLLLKGYELDEINTNNKKRFFFCFIEEPQESEIESFMFNKAKVAPLEYYSKIKDAKSLIYNMRSKA